MSVRGNRRRRSLALLCWFAFAAGLLVQLLSPHLKISNGAFVTPLVKAEPLLSDYGGIDRSRAFFASQFSIRLAERNDANQHCQLK